MKKILRENMVKPIKLEDITPDALSDIHVKRDNVRLGELTLSSLEEVARERKEALQLFNNIELECQARAMRASVLGFSKVELADALGVEVKQITKWIGSGKNE
jgi:hypothetical protein